VNVSCQVQMNELSQALYRKRKLPCPKSSGPIKKKVCISPGNKVISPKLPFWNDLSKKWSDKLMSCSQTCCDDMASDSWNQSFRDLAQNSWFSVKGQKLKEPKQFSNDQLLHHSLQGNMSDDTDMKAMKIRIFPTNEQKQILSKWFGTCRWTYNQCVNSFQTKTSKAKKKDLRARHVNNDNFKEENTWVPETPYDIRDEAMNDFLKALKATKAKKDLKHFQFKFRSKKDNTQCMAVLKKHWGHKRGVYSDLFNADKMKAEKKYRKHSTTTLASLKRDWINIICAYQSQLELGVKIKLPMTKSIAQYLLIQAYVRL